MTFCFLCGINIYIGGIELKKGIIRIFVLLTCILLCLNITGCKNKNYQSFSKTIKYSELDNTDKKMLSELNKVLYKSKAVIWQDLDLKQKPLLLVRKDENDDKGNKSNKDISYFAINIAGIENENVKKVNMPKGFYFDSVYRFNNVEDYLSALNNNYSSKNDELTIAKSQNVFYFKYNSKSFNNEEYPNEAFSAMFTKQAFNYYIQKDWPKYDNPASVGLTAKELSYIGVEYKIMDNIRKECNKDNVNINKLNTLISEYVTVEKEREKLNETYIKDEREKITYEGSAFYVAIRAARLTETPYNLIFFGEDNEEKETAFYNTFTKMSKDEIPATYVSEQSLYSIGAQLCIMLNNLNISDWQKEINASYDDNVVTIYDVIYKYYEDNKLKEKSIDDVKEKYDYDEILKEAKKIQRLL